MRRAPEAAGAAVLAALLIAACGTDDSKKKVPLTPAKVRPVEKRAARAPGFEAARITKRTQLRDEPGGRVVAAVRPRTEFDSPRYLSIAGRAGDWLGVVSSTRPNGELAWVHRSRVEVVSAPASIHVDLSARRAWVRRAGKTVMRFPIAIGQPDSPTPKGRFAVTDALGTRGNSPYGCCILALSAHQPSIPQGWTGGDRVAIHATPAVHSIGTAASNGCMRTTDTVMRRLFKAVTLGAPVFIRT